MLRLLAGAAAGLLTWAALGIVLAHLPQAAAFWVSWGVFTFGPGAIVGIALTRDLDPARRFVVLMGLGSAVTPLLIDTLGHLHAIPLFPYIATSCAGIGVAAWRVGRVPIAQYALLPPGERPTFGVMRHLVRSETVACLLLIALAGTLGAIVFWHRLDVSSSGISLYGDYDSADLGYYASEASEASHTVPPMAAYYSGHKLNAAYYPHLVLGMVHRFSGVPVLTMYYLLAWPTFLTMVALTLYTLVRSLASRGVALLAAALAITCSDFSYLAAWLLPHTNVDWDYVLWPTNFLSPTMHVLHFATWTPSLPVFFTALFAIVRGFQTRSTGWLVVSALVIGVLFEFKPFSYIVLMAGLAASVVFAGRDWAARWRYALTIVLGLACTIPSVVRIMGLDASDRRSQLYLTFFLLPKRMLIKLDLADAFTSFAARVAPAPALATPILILAATILFLAVGVGIRWIAAPGIWRAVRRAEGPDGASWRLLGWVSIAGLAIPCVLATEPYVDTLQFYLTGLYIMWVFTAVAMVRFAAAHRRVGPWLVALAVAAVLPSSVHYWARKWHDAERPPKASLTRGDLQIASYFQATDPETTVILHDRPLAPSLMTIVAKRRIVLGWDVRYSAVGGEGRLRDVNAFFASADSADPEPALEILRRYHVTHVLVRSPEDRVHPAVLERLQLVMRYPEVALYRVPSPARP